MYVILVHIKFILEIVKKYIWNENQIIKLIRYQCWKKEDSYSKELGSADVALMPLASKL